MLRKLRELIRDLTATGFVECGGKGRHRNFKHPRGAKITISGHHGDDAKRYQERELEKALQEARL